MTEWRASGALARALLVSGVGLALALALGRPVVVVLVAPLVVLGALGLLHKPLVNAHVVLPGIDAPPCCTRARARGRGWRSSDGRRRRARDPGRRPGRHVALRPVDRRASATCVGPTRARCRSRPRRWGQPPARRGEGRADSAGGPGYRWGPVAFVGREVLGAAHDRGARRDRRPRPRSRSA